MKLPSVGINLPFFCFFLQICSDNGSKLDKILKAPRVAQWTGHSRVFWVGSAPGSLLQGEFGGAYPVP